MCEGVCVRAGVSSMGRKTGPPLRLEGKKGVEVAVLQFLAVLLGLPLRLPKEPLKERKDRQNFCFLLTI